MKWFVDEAKSSPVSSRWFIVSAEGSTVLPPRLTEAEARNLVRLHNQDLENADPESPSRVAEKLARGILRDFLRENDGVADVFSLIDGVRFAALSFGVITDEEAELWDANAMEARGESYVEAISSALGTHEGETQ